MVVDEVKDENTWYAGYMLAKTLDRRCGAKVSKGAGPVYTCQDNMERLNSGSCSCVDYAGWGVVGAKLMFVGCW